MLGYDAFEDLRISNNWQSATGYALLTFFPNVYHDNGTASVIVPQYGAEIIWGAVLQDSMGASFKTNSWYVNDTWRLNDRWTFSLGLRHDQNDGTDAGGMKVANDSRISPRIAVSYDVFGDGNWVVNAALARYVAALASNQADAASAGGQPTWAFYYYGGPDLNTGCVTNQPETCMRNSEVIEEVMDWFLNVYGGPSNTDLADGSAEIPGLSPRMIPGGLESPYTDEYSIGLAKRLGTKGMVRVDYVHRESGSFYARMLNQNTGTVSHPLAGTLDVAYIFNEDSVLERVYDGLMTRFNYRLTDALSIGANWTWSHARGNFDGENAGSGALSSTFFEYPEYKDIDWNMSRGDTAIDQRHVLRAWAIYDIFSTERHNLSVSLLQNYWSGTPYEALGTAQTYNANTGEDYLPDYGYMTPPSSVGYYFGPRGQFRTDDITRTDISLNYSFYFDILGTEIEVFIQPEVLNLFNEDGMVDCGGSCSMILTRYNNSGLEPFNPYTEAPVYGTHWDFHPNWGTAINENDYQLARTFRLSFGLRF